MVIDLSLDYKYIKFAAWDGDTIAWLKRVSVVAAILFPNLVEYFCLTMLKDDGGIIPLVLFSLNKVQIVTVIGCILGSVFGHNFEQIGDKVPKFIEVHTVSSLSYFVVVEALVVLEVVFQSNVLVANILNKFELTFGILGKPSLAVVKFAYAFYFLNVQVAWKFSILLVSHIISKGIQR